MTEFILVGLSHKTCSVETREAFSITPERRRLLLKAMLSGGLAADELVWVSTCNRVDLYAVGRKKECEAGLIAFLSDPSRYDAGKESRGHLYSKAGKEALDHLLNVACGLDSMVVGENEILGQLKDSYYAAKSAGATGRLTNVLFQRAIGVGKQVRTSTKISRGGRSVAYVAVQYAGRIFGELPGARVLLLGAGEMAEAAALAFTEKKARLTVINRTGARARELAEKFSAASLPWEKLEEALAASDVVLVSTSAPEPVITRELMKKIMALRHGAPVFLVDISVPRNVQPGAGELSNVYLYNIDDLERIVKENLAQLSEEIAKARGIIGEKSAEIWGRLSEDFSAGAAGAGGPLLIGTRGSRLALAQTEIIRGLLKAGGAESEKKIIKTSGDAAAEESLEKLVAAGGKGLFVKEIEKELLDGGVRLAMHSLKDLPGELAEGLTVAACLRREDPRDALVTRSGLTLAQLPPGARIASGSLRRRLQIARLRPDAVFVPLRGNMDTRLAKLDRGDCDAIVAASAALKRLGLENRITQCFSVDEVVPAPGQGVIAVEARASDLDALRLARRLDHARTATCAECERLFLAAMGGGCATPLGAYAEVTEEGLLFRVFWSDPSGASRLNFRTYIDCSRMGEAVAELAGKIRRFA